MSEFLTLKQKMAQKYLEIEASGHLFQADVNPEDLWNAYLQNIPEDLRQSNNCNCCKAFIRQFGAVIGITPSYEVVTLWDFDAEDPEYDSAIKALRRAVSTAPIKGIFQAIQQRYGTEKNHDPVRQVTWNHFAVSLPKRFVLGDPGAESSKAAAASQVLSRGLAEFSLETLDTVLELITQNRLYRGAEFKKVLEDFRKVKSLYEQVPSHKRIAFGWYHSKRLSSAVSSLRNTSIGTLLINISEGKDLEASAESFGKMLDPVNYRRPKSIVTPKMIDKAKERIAELGLLDALKRRQATPLDVPIADALYVDRPVLKSDDVFDTLKSDTKVTPKSLTKVEEVSIDDFVEKILPGCKSFRVLFENRHQRSMVSLIAPEDLEVSKGLMKWPNGCSWDYTGNLADARIKERVKLAGGSIEGALRVSLSWSNYDDLDLSIGGHSSISYFNKHGQCGGCLDVDMNAGSGSTRSPVENVIWKNRPKPGSYPVFVNNYAPRENSGVGFTIEIEADGEIHQIHSDNNLQGRGRVKIAEVTVNRDGTFKVEAAEGYSTNSSGNSAVKWGLTTNQFHKVQLMTLSPNHWAGSIGNKHYFLFLEGCISDESPRSFFNENLNDNLREDRKVLELLATKISVAKTPNELSGLGFSETNKDHFFAEVVGTFKSILKVNI